jgi:hypothetical protein
MATVNLYGTGHLEAETVGATKTLDLGDSGAVQDCPVTTTITLPATVVGSKYLIRVAKAGITVTISPNASDKIAGNGYTPVDNKDIVFTNQPAGSFVELIADGVNGYMVGAILGTATYES